MPIVHYSTSVRSSSTIMPTTMRRIVITGGEGQLARAIREVASGTENEYITLSHRDADICNREMMERLVKGGVDIVINCAAYTNVDGAEESVYDAERINTYGVEILALWVASTVF